MDEPANEIARRCAEAGIQTAQLHGKAARRAVTQLHEDLHLIYVMNCQPDGRCVTPMPAMLAEEHEGTLSRYTGVAHLPRLPFGKIALSVLAQKYMETLPWYACSPRQDCWPLQQPAQPRVKAAEAECWSGQPGTCCLVHLALRQSRPDVCHASWGSGYYPVCVSLARSAVWGQLHQAFIQLIDPDACHAH